MVNVSGLPVLIILIAFSMDLVLSLALSVLLATFVFLSRASRFPLPIPLPIHAFFITAQSPFFAAEPIGLSIACHHSLQAVVRLAGW